MCGDESRHYIGVKSRCRFGCAGVVGREELGRGVPCSHVPGLPDGQPRPPPAGNAAREPVELHGGAADGLHGLVQPSPPPGASRKAGYARFVETGIAETDVEFRTFYQGARRREDMSLRRELDRIPVECVLETVAATFGEPVEAITRRRRGSLARAAACWHLRDASGLSQRQIAEHMDLSSGAAVGYQLDLWQTARTGKTGTKSGKEIRRKLHDEAVVTYSKG